MKKSSGITLFLALAVMFFFSSFSSINYNSKLQEQNRIEKQTIITGSFALSSPNHYFSNGCVAWLTTTLYFAYNTSTHLFVGYYVDNPVMHMSCPSNDPQEHFARISVTGNGDGITDITLDPETRDEDLAEMLSNNDWKNAFIDAMNEGLQDAIR